MVICHAEGARLGIASNHGDVEHWFPRFGKSMDDFRNDVKEELEMDSYEKFKENMERYRQELREQPASDWFQQQDQAAVEALGIFKPDGAVTYPQDLITREQVGALFARYDERRG